MHTTSECPTSLERVSLLQGAMGTTSGTLKGDYEVVGGWKDLFCVSSQALLGACLLFLTLVASVLGSLDFPVWEPKKVFLRVAEYSVCACEFGRWAGLSVKGIELLLGNFDSFLCSC